MEMHLEAADCGRLHVISVAVLGRTLVKLWGYSPAVTFLQIGVGAVVYGMILLVLRDPFIWKQVERIIKKQEYV